jgi:hypothetical protein
VAEQLTYSSRAAAIRETVKWIAVVFMGTGAVLFSGLSFTNLTSIAASGKWYVLVPLSVVPVAAAVWVIREATRIVTLRPPEVGRILPRFAVEALKGVAPPDDGLRAKLEAALPPTVAVYGGIAEYEQRLLRAHAVVTQAANALEQQDVSARRDDLERAYLKLDELQAGVQDLVACGDYLAVSAEYDSRSPRFVIAGALAIAGLVVVACLHSSQSAAEKSATTSPLSVSAPLKVRIYLPGPLDYDAVGPDHCPVWDGRPAIVTGGTLTNPRLTFDGALPDVKLHPLGVEARERCSEPWVWDAKEAGLTVVPRDDTGEPG